MELAAREIRPRGVPADTAPDHHRPRGPDPQKPGAGPAKRHRPQRQPTGPRPPPRSMTRPHRARPHQTAPATDPKPRCRRPDTHRSKPDDRHENRHRPRHRHRRHRAFCADHWPLPARKPRPRPHDGREDRRGLCPHGNEVRLQGQLRQGQPVLDLDQARPWHGRGAAHPRPDQVRVRRARPDGCPRRPPMRPGGAGLRRAADPRLPLPPDRPAAGSG